MWNVIECSSNYSETTGNIYLYSKDETTNSNIDIATTNNLKSLKCKAKLIGKH